MRTLSEIIDETRDGGRPDYEELRYALCAMTALSGFANHTLMRLAEGERDGKKPVLTYSTQWQWNEHFEREKRAYQMDPKVYVGWNNDPDNPEFVKRRKAATVFVKKIAAAKSGGDSGASGNG